VTANDGPAFGPAGPNNNRYRGTPEHFMPDLDRPEERGQRMQPVFFLTGEKVEFGTRDADRRGQLAEWITAVDNPWFSRAFVNRIWAELVGEGFFEPVDDLGPDRKPSAPETLDCLAAAFTESGYDVKWLLRTITATEAYQRESRARRNPDEPPFAANVAQRLRADQVYNNLRQALQLPQPMLAARGPYGVNRTPQALFSQVFGYDPSERRDEVAGSIPQALVMMNSPMLSAAMQAGPPMPGRFEPGAFGRPPFGRGPAFGVGRRAPQPMLERLLRENDDDRDLVVELYLRVLARKPSSKELRTCLAYRRDVKDRAEAFEDILWSLVNSTEFLHRS
jgi:hypothetical protein